MQRYIGCCFAAWCVSWLTLNFLKYVFCLSHSYRAIRWTYCIWILWWSFILKLTVSATHFHWLLNNFRQVLSILQTTNYTLDSSDKHAEIYIFWQAENFLSSIATFADRALDRCWVKNEAKLPLSLQWGVSLRVTMVRQGIYGQGVATATTALRNDLIWITPQSSSHKVISSQPKVGDTSLKQ